MERLFWPLIAALVVCACSGNDHVTESEATDGWGLVGPPLQQGLEKLQEKVQEKADEDQQSLIEGEPVEYLEECDSSGEVRFEFVLDPSGDELVDVTADFWDCTTEQTIISGEIDIDSPNDFGIQEAASGGDEGSGPTVEELDYDGTLQFEGDIDGPCEVDMTVDLTSGQPSYSGTFCGYDASEVTGFGALL